MEFKTKPDYGSGSIEIVWMSIVHFGETARVLAERFQRKGEGLGSGWEVSSTKTGTPPRRYRRPRFPGGFRCQADCPARREGSW